MRLAGRIVLTFLSIGVAVYAVVAYAAAPLGALVHPAMMPAFAARPVGVYVHVFSACVALLLGPFQFSERLRSSRTSLHRRMGFAYLVIGVLLGGLSGLYLAASAFGGLIAQAGFAALALGWLFTGLRAYLAIRRGAIEEHRTWMKRNFALTFAAVMLRLYIPAATLAGVDFSVAYPAVAWLCWVPNLVAVELLRPTPAPRTLPRAPTAPAA